MGRSPHPTKALLTGALEAWPWWPSQKGDIDDKGQKGGQTRRWGKTVAKSPCAVPGPRWPLGLAEAPEWEPRAGAQLAAPLARKPSPLPAPKPSLPADGTWRGRKSKGREEVLTLLLKVCEVTKEKARRSHAPAALHPSMCIQQRSGRYRLALDLLAVTKMPPLTAARSAVPAFPCGADEHLNLSGPSPLLTPSSTPQGS